MHDDRALIEGRIARDLNERLMPQMYSARHALTVEAWEVPGEPVPFAEAVAAVYRPLSVGDHYGRPWGTTWFRVSGQVPAVWAGTPVELVVDLGFHPDSAGFQSEALVYTADGQPVQGIHPRRTAVPIESTPGPFQMYIEAASNPAFPSFRPSLLGRVDTAGNEPIYRLRQADVAVRNDDVFHLLLDIEVLDGLMRTLPTTSPRRQRLLRQLHDTFEAIDMTDVGGSVARARAMLRPALDLPAESSAHRIVGVGHAHIDTAWLWPLRETRRKCARTFASAVRLMDRYPDYRFVCSQAVQYQWIEQDHPQLFQRIAHKVAEGQWIPVGGMWVEPDMNLASGESIVRQLVHGQRYFESRFGRRCTEIWIPDVFGYPASLPQVFRAAGIERFVTQKLSWNKTNRFPHSTFWWKGLDGSRVLTHFPPVETYNAAVVADELRHATDVFAEHGWSDWSLMPYGHGNGGGGPTREMVERAHRFADLDGAPRLSLGSVDGFFAAVEREALEAPVPEWDGELYFEMHRGTLTSQAQTKVGNRRCERLLREAELWTAAAGRDAPLLGELWEELLVQQFHDILPGSSIGWVHDDAALAHRRIAGQVEAIVVDALAALVDQPSWANAATWMRDEVVIADDPPIGSAPDAGDPDDLIQKLADGGVAYRVTVPGLGIGAARAAAVEHPVVVTERTMSNGIIAVGWNESTGELNSIIDIGRSRQVLPTGHTVQLLLAEDRPVLYDAWDTESWTRAGGRVVDEVAVIEVVEHGPLLGRVRVIRRLPSGTAIVARYTLRAGSPLVEIDFDIDWREDERLLSVHVPIDIRAREAACDIQFGHVMRPTHASTSWDAAKFEVCAHRFVDLSEPDFGVAVLNNGRYGHGLHRDGITVSLLKAPKYPDPQADQGIHRVELAILPHGAGLTDVLARAEAWNLPLRYIGGGLAESAAQPVISLDNQRVQISAIKRADDTSGDLIVRLYEATGGRARASITTPGRVACASRCDIYEVPLVDGGVEVSDGVLVVDLAPFELATLRITRA